MLNGKGSIEIARERLVKAVNHVLGVVRRNGRSRKVGLALVLTVLVGGRARVRNAAETFGLDYSNLLEALGKLLREHDSRTHRYVSQEVQFEPGRKRRDKKSHKLFERRT